MGAKNRIGGGEPITRENIRPIEERVLRYLDQRGARHRRTMVEDLVSPESRIGRGISNGSNAFVPAIAARWCARLVNAGLVRDQRNQDAFHLAYVITHAGKRFLRESHP